jgi:hypothetical protein
MGKKKEIQVTSAGSTLTKEPERRLTPEKHEELETKAHQVIEMIREQGLSLRQACLRVNTPANSMLQYIAIDTRLIEQYANAMDVRADLLAENMLEKTRDRSNDMYTDKDGNLRPNPVAVQRDRLIADKEQWYISVVAPKKYGNQLNINAEVKHTAPLSIDQVNDILKQLDSNTIDVTPEAETE